MAALLNRQRMNVLLMAFSLPLTTVSLRCYEIRPRWSSDHGRTKPCDRVPASAPYRRDGTGTALQVVLQSVLMDWRPRPGCRPDDADHPIQRRYRLGVGYRSGLGTVQRLERCRGGATILEILVEAKLVSGMILASGPSHDRSGNGIVTDQN